VQCIVYLEGQSLHLSNSKIENILYILAKLNPSLSIVIFVILGSVLEGIPAMVLFGPLLFPVARGMGDHEVHYAIVIIMTMGIGLFAPPLGVGYYL